MQKALVIACKSAGMSTLGVNFVRKMQVGLCDKIVVQDLDLFHKNNSGESFNVF